MTDFIYVPVILIIVVVMPIWIVFHYVTMWKRDKALSAEDESSFGDLRGNAEKLEDRLNSLERILDEEIPDWRQRQNDPL